ncbi:rhodanese-like domain-containing protein [Anditalea andensis]|uniref:Rhodanese domain-containing protein n=1 Tax=Anditalea andensis TaxID=1048983 RepID=A0A074KXQ1_9BACT|nr:rhodanese-like domain-containing protein [Anditalea andensis]KEO72388.1 hypothetical protein EL17_16715 [Anditalea andensis]
MKEPFSIFMSCLLFLLGSCHSSFMSNEELLDPQEFESGLKKNINAVLIDVRSTEEIKYGHMEDAIFINCMDESFETYLNYLRKDLPYFIYCNTTEKTIPVSRIMKSMGFTHVYILKGGLQNWRQKGKKIVHPQT